MVLDKCLDDYAKENSSWTEVRDGNDGIKNRACQFVVGSSSLATTDVVFDIQLVQSKQRMTEIIKHATSEEVSELF